MAADLEQKIDWPTLKLYSSTFEVDGVHFAYEMIPLILREVIHGDPRKWYRFERVGDHIQVHIRLTEEEPSGTPIATSGDADKSART